MHLALLVAWQLQAAGLEVATRGADAFRLGDSLHDLSRARGAQVSFERSRRSLLPTSSASGGRCDVRLGRYCWWYDDRVPSFPPESEIIGRRRTQLLADLDALGARYGGDDWLSAMRVHYRVDGRDLPGADSVARTCRATGWWCSALVGYAAHARGNGRVADSAFASALAAMPADIACAWRNITPLLADDERDGYAHRTCEARGELERRYWLLSRPQLSSAANEWQNEFNVRRVLVWLGERGATPHLLTWGTDAAELVLRYGWPVAWSRMVTSGAPGAEAGIIGHDPSPSFVFAPRAVFTDSLHPVADDRWDLHAPRGESRYAPRLVKRVAGIAVQVARFRRGDSTLVVAAYAAADDSLRAPVAIIGAAATDGAIRLGVDSARTGRAVVTIAGMPVLVGVEVTDTLTRTLARSRAAFVPTAPLSVSDLLFYRSDRDPATRLDSALTKAIPGDTVTRNRQLGIFWETYDPIAGGEGVEVAVSVERIDRGWMRSTRQRLGLTPLDTPIRMRWTDGRPAGNGATAHAVSLDLTNLDAGRYRVTLTLGPAYRALASTSREMQLSP